VSTSYVIFACIERFHLDLLDNEDQLTYRSDSFADRRHLDDNDDEEQYMILRATSSSNNTNAGNNSLPPLCQ
jgi:hypothetical protein